MQLMLSETASAAAFIIVYPHDSFVCSSFFTPQLPELTQFISLSRLESAASSQPPGIAASCLNLPPLALIFPPHVCRVESVPPEVIN